MPKSTIRNVSSSSLSRRSFVSAASVAAVLGTSVLGRRAVAEDMPRLSEDDPTAVALKYVHDATTLDASVRPED
ncbi:MAG: High potential iron-sulfur protein, partial [Pseudomonadota bacterium]